MILLSFDVVPTVENEDFHHIDGAIVMAWIPSDQASDVLEAETIARTHIEKCNWFIKSLDEVSEIEESEYEPYDEHREYFEAVLSGEQAYVFYTYPNEDSEE